MTDNNLERIGEKILQELNDDEWKMILTITKENYLLKNKMNLVCILCSEIR